MLTSIMHEFGMTTIRFADIHDNGVKELLANSPCKKYLNYIYNECVGEVMIDTTTHELAGYIFVKNNEKEKGFIFDVTVEKPYRGNGYSHTLVDHAITKYHGRDLTVDKTNEIAISLYKKHGFIVFKDLGKQYWMVLSKYKKEFEDAEK